METVYLIQATMVGAPANANRLLYTVQVDLGRVKQVYETSDDDDALSAAIRDAQSTITKSFPQYIVVWENPVAFALTLPGNDPIYRMDGVNVWVLPVVVNNEAYFYLVG